MMREGVRRIISTANEMQVVGEAEDGVETLDALRKVECDILMLDMTMPGMGGIELIQRVKEFQSDLPILVLSMHNVAKIAAAALKAGAAGYLTKDSDPERLVDVIGKIASGGKYVDPVVADKIVFDGVEEQLPHLSLSGREYEILMMIVAGKSTSRIADELFLSPKTVSTHKKHIMEKMQMENAADMVRYAIEHHLR